MMFFKIVLSLILASFITVAFADATANTSQPPRISLDFFCRNVEYWEDALGEAAVTNVSIASKDLSQLVKSTRTYMVDASFEKVWKEYIETSPFIVFSNISMKLHSVFIPQTAQRVTSVVNWGGLTVGNKLYLNMQTSMGCQLMTALQATVIDKNEKLIRFDYLENVPVVGYQTLKFEEKAETDVQGNTKTQTTITHDSFYYSEFYYIQSNYDRYHNPAIDNLHLAIKQRLEGAR